MMSFFLFFTTHLFRFFVGSKYSFLDKAIAPGPEITYILWFKLHASLIALNFLTLTTSSLPLGPVFPGGPGGPISTFLLLRPSLTEIYRILKVGHTPQKEKIM